MQFIALESFLSGSQRNSLHWKKDHQKSLNGFNRLLKRCIFLEIVDILPNNYNDDDALPDS